MLKVSIKTIDLFNSIPAVFIKKYNIKVTENLGETFFEFTYNKLTFQSKLENLSRVQADETLLWLYFDNGLTGVTLVNMTLSDIYITA